jgi:hypothetical protein
MNQLPLTRQIGNCYEYRGLKATAKGMSPLRGHGDYVAVPTASPK